MKIILETDHSDNKHSCKLYVEGILKKLVAIKFKHIYFFCIIINPNLNKRVLNDR